MNIDTSKVTALSDEKGVIVQIADAAGNVLWSATIKFTINGDTYIADRGMTWAEWFASDYNTTGKTADDVQSISANGTAVELSAVIVGGTAYEVGFVTIISFTIAGTTYQAEEGMTWVEWCDSEYCPMMNAYQKAFFTYGNDQYVQASDATGNVQYNGRFVYGGDTLIDGASYTKYFEVGGWD